MSDEIRIYEFRCGCQIVLHPVSGRTVLTVDRACGRLWVTASKIPGMNLRPLERVLIHLRTVDDNNPTLEQVFRKGMTQ